MGCQMREIQCEISRIIINEAADGQIVWLQEKKGDRAFAIVVGFFEASSLRDRIKEFAPPRPMTHHLISNAIRELGGALDRVVITELKDNTYFARLMVRQGERVVEVDARPSDAIVLAAQEKVAIFVAEEVLAEASKWSVAPHLTFTPEESAEGKEGEEEEGEEEEEEGFGEEEEE